VIDREPSAKDMARLWELCANFIEQNRIWSDEFVYVSDRVVENSYAFIASICNEVGYFDLEEEE
jgi:glutaminase